jgi:tetratricopeptide (TPR) repeat protein
MLNQIKNDERLSRRIRIPAVAGFLLLLLLMTWITLRAGFASLLYAYAARLNESAAANAAVNLSPRDAQAHYIRGAVLEARQDLRGAAVEYTQAVSLRPHDYVLWIALARARELNGDMAGAVAAARQAVSQAPFYAQPHWQLGNLLIRAGNHDDGFSELRLAVKSNPSLLPAVIDLASHFAENKPDYFLQAIQPRSPEEYKALAEYFGKRGQAADAIAMFRAAGAGAERERRSYLEALIAAKQFKEAFALWTKETKPDGEKSPVLHDPGFEQGSDLDEPGFGWRAKNKSQGFLLSLDGSNPKEGKWSAAVEFKGESDPGQAVISQLVLIEPRARYELHFAARTESLVSGGLPYLTVTDAGNQEVLGQTPGFPQTSGGWHDYTIDFTAPNALAAIQIELRRQSCSNSPCPIFGRLWLDDFSIRRL